MRKTLLTILATSALVASAAQMASAAERHSGRAQRAPVASEDYRAPQFRNSNAYFAPSYNYDDASRLANGGQSAPAGR